MYKKSDFQSAVNGHICVIFDIFYIICIYKDYSTLILGMFLLSLVFLSLVNL